MYGGKFYFKYQLEEHAGRIKSLFSKGEQKSPLGLSKSGASAKLTNALGGHSFKNEKAAQKWAKKKNFEYNITHAGFLSELTGDPQDPSAGLTAAQAATKAEEGKTIRVTYQPKKKGDAPRSVTISMADARKIQSLNEGVVIQTGRDKSTGKLNEEKIEEWQFDDGSNEKMLAAIKRADRLRDAEAGKAKTLSEAGSGSTVISGRDVFPPKIAEDGEEPQVGGARKHLTTDDKLTNLEYITGRKPWRDNPDKRENALLHLENIKKKGNLSPEQEKRVKEIDRRILFRETNPLH
jgi:hypothetical protein